MQNFGSKDFFNVSKAGFLGEGAIPCLYDLYLPLIGAKSLGLYFGLLSLSEDPLALYDGSRLSKVTSLTFGEIQSALTPLESTGLVKTLLGSDARGTKVYCFEIFSPLSPKSFFSNILFSGAIYSYIGAEDYSKLKKKYQVKGEPKGFKDISASFSDTFTLDFANASLADSSFSALGEGPNKIKTNFDYSLFLNVLKKNGFKDNCLSPDELSFIEQLSALYGYSSDTVAGFVSDSCINSFKPFGEKLSKEKLKAKCRDGVKVRYLRSSGKKSSVSGVSALSSKIKVMDALPSAKYLQLKQGNHKPASSDLKTLEKINIDMGLPSPALNALIDYVLETNDNVLSAPLMEKLAATLVRANVDSSRDAMEYLNGQIKLQREKKSSSTYNNKGDAASALPSNPIQEEKKEEEDLDALFAKLNSK